MRRKDLCTRNCTSVQRCGAVLPVSGQLRGRRDACGCALWSERDWHEDEDRRFLFNITKGRLPGRTRASRGPGPRSLRAVWGHDKNEEALQACVLRRESQCGEKKKRNIREGSSGAPGRACGASPGVSDQAEVGALFLGVRRLIEQFTRPAVCAGVQEKSSCLVCAGVHIVGRVNCARAARTRQHAAAQDGGLLQVERPR